MEACQTSPKSKDPSARPSGSSLAEEEPSVSQGRVCLSICTFSVPREQPVGRVASE